MVHVTLPDPIGLMRAPLTSEESHVLEQLAAMAGGVGMMREVSGLADDLRRALPSLSDKGYVMLTQSKYLVVTLASG